MIPLILERMERAHQEFTWAELCYQIIPCATLLRWRARVQAGQVPVEPAGPRKKAPLDLERLRQQIEQLRHRRRRSSGSGALYEQWSQFISRREFQELVAQERQNQWDGMRRIEWLQPGMAWSLDTTEYGTEKSKITPLRDLASKYQVPSPLVEPREQGERIALYLERIFQKEGPPMFLKRDNGSPLNCQAVDQVLERHRVLFLNNPPGYPRYNGSIERGISDLKAALDQRRTQGLGQNVPLALEVELVTHQLNHRRLRSLGNLTPCQVYHDPQKRLRLHGAQREKIFREIFEQFWQIAQCMPERNRHTLRAAWRLLVEDWLRSHNWISVRDNHQQNVSTNSNDIFSQN